MTELSNPIHEMAWDLQTEFLRSGGKRIVSGDVSFLDDDIDDNNVFTKMSVELVYELVVAAPSNMAWETITGRRNVKNDTSIFDLLESTLVNHDSRIVVHPKHSPFVFPNQHLHRKLSRLALGVWTNLVETGAWIYMNDLRYQVYPHSLPELKLKDIPCYTQR